MTRSFILFLVGLPLAAALGGLFGYVLGCEHGAKAGYTQAVKNVQWSMKPS